jgi:hypothetical protein
MDTQANCFAGAHHTTILAEDTLGFFKSDLR